MSDEDLTAEKVTNKRQRTESPQVVDEFPTLSFNANQVVNRLLEVYSTTYKLGNTHRLELLGELFAENASILSFNNKALVSGQSAIIQSFKNTSPSASQSSRRVFIGDEEGRQKSYVIDFYIKGSSPGLGDPKSNVVILYQTENSKIVRIYGGNDKEGVCSAKKYEKSDFLKSKIWSTLKQLIENGETSLTDDMLHYHDYRNMETWG